MMKPCEHLPHYLDGRLERAGREYFEEHLVDCSDCRKLMDVWACTKNVLKNEAKERRMSLVPTDEEASRLVQRAILEASSNGFFSAKVLVPLTACVSFAAAFMLATHVSNSTIQNSEMSQSQGVNNAVILEAAETPKGPTIEYESKLDGRTIGRFGNDRFGLAAMSKLRLISSNGKSVILRLEHGVAAFSVAKREAGRQFIVEAGDFQVIVVGTRFTVDNTDGIIRVSVAEGLVKVLEHGEREWHLSAGEALTVSLDGIADLSITDNDEEEETARLLGEIEEEQFRSAMLLFPFVNDNEAASPKIVKRGERNLNRPRNLAKSSSLSNISSVKEPSLEEPVSTSAESSKENKPSAVNVDDILSNYQGIELWRSWVLEGRFEAAETALLNHLSSHPVDTEAYSLLADCRRKAGKYVEAVETYKKLTAIAGDYQANRARFKAGVLLQENLQNHLGAAAIFDDYLATGKGTPLLRAKAAIRLAASLIKLGETERARKLLVKITEENSGSSVAMQARDMLRKMN